MQIDVSEWLGRHIYVTGEYEPATTKVVLERLQSGGVFVDVGANAGYFSLLAARTVGRGGRVISFEPVPMIAKRLRENIALNQVRNCDVREVAVSNEIGTCDIHIGPNDHTGVSSLRAVANSSGVAKVRMTTLDVELTTLERLDLIKIDVEGAECHVLEGMQQILRRFQPDIVLEVTPQFLQSLGRSTSSLEASLAPHGYKAFAIYKNGLKRLNRLADYEHTQFNAYFTTAD